MAEEKIPLVYKGHPLRRKDNLIYYGSMADKYIIMMQIMDTKKVKDLDVATRVSVQLQLTDPDLKSRDRMVKKTEKDSLYNAMDVASVWLERSLSSK
ncbi:hypothetical protein [uncultured Pseudoflavonifractor sp.]|uniref:hypothetical protein n=1 Tax=uncultured Pseudoflavonifractor sp. TaxID=1221379 RepID=UPI0025ECF21F|nr:hypothetical protein [uncultured Pseudoflavonifractor sp.]